MVLSTEKIGSCTGNSLTQTVTSSSFRFFGSPCNWAYFGCPESISLFQGTIYSPPWGYVGCPEIINLFQGAVYSPLWAYYGCPEMVILFQDAIYSPSWGYLLTVVGLFWLPRNHNFIPGYRLLTVVGLFWMPRNRNFIPGCYLLTAVGVFTHRRGPILAAQNP